MAGKARDRGVFATAAAPGRVGLMCKREAQVIRFVGLTGCEFGIALVFGWMPFALREGVFT